MRFTYNWLKDFVDIKLSPQALADKLTMSGLEITDMQKRSGDSVLELEITSNRPDWLSVIGIAREVAAITGKKLKIASKAKGKTAGKSSDIDVKVENPKDCPLYTARLIENVKVKPSPKWLKDRLEAVGVRSVNNIVDITNYVLLETGHPLHAFDFDKIKGNGIVVRRSKNKEKITTIDEQALELDNDTLVIADKSGPVALAGVMGGKESEVGLDTKNILLEAAVFDPIIVRRAARKLATSSESSYRFERGVPPEGVNPAADRAESLILEFASGKAVAAVAKGSFAKKEKAIILSSDVVAKVLGKEYSLSQVQNILSPLGFSASKQSGGALKVKVPFFRMDVNQSVDLIEEVARVAGYDSIPSRLPRVINQQAKMSKSYIQKQALKMFLSGQGMNEVITYSLISRQRAIDFGYAASDLRSVANPLSNQQEVLRPSLMPGFLAGIKQNINQKQSSIKIFETGNVFNRGQEKLCLGIAYCDKELNFLHLKGALECLFEHLGINEYEFVQFDNANPYLQPEVALSLVLNNKNCGSLGMVKPGISQALDIEDCVFAAELDLEAVFALADKVKRKYTALSLYPDVMRDISIMLKENIAAGEVIKQVKQGNVPYLIAVDLKDTYIGKQIPAGQKGLTLSCVYRASDRTLTSQEIDSSHQKALDILQGKFAAQQR